MSTYQTYQFGGKTIERQNVKTAVASFYCKHDRLPNCIAIHPSQAQAVRDHLQALSLDISLVESGGTLANELWLEISNTKPKKEKGD